MKKMIALLGLFLLGCGDDYPVRVGAGVPSTLRLSPAHILAAVGQEFTTSVEVVDAQALFGLAFEVTYDPGLLEATSVTAGPALGSDALFFEQRESEKVSVAVTKKRGTTPFTGSGVIATLRFRALKPGRSNLSFVQSTTEAAGTEGQPVANIAHFVVQSGSVNVLTAGE